MFTDIHRLVCELPTLLRKHTIYKRLGTADPFVTDYVSIKHTECSIHKRDPAAVAGTHLTDWAVVFCRE